MPNKTDNIAHQPNQIAERVAAFLKEGNLEGVVSMFHPECSIYFPLDEAPKVGHTGVREVFADFVEARPTLVSTVTHESTNGSIAVLQAKWRLEESDGVLIAEGFSTEVAKKLANGGWGYFIDCPIGLPQLSSVNVV
jgi:ketosteroid isomerase-like protein